MRFLTVASGTNRTGRNDSTGVFRPYAECFRRMHHAEQPVHYFKSEWSAEKRRQWFRETVESAGQFECFAFFGHGYMNGLQLGFIGREQMKEFSTLLGRAGVTHALFYACLMGERGLPLVIGTHCKTLKLCLSHMSTSPMVPKGGHAVWNPKIRVDVWDACRNVETFMLDDMARETGDSSGYRALLRASAKSLNHYAFNIPFYNIWDNTKLDVDEKILPR